MKICQQMTRAIQIRSTSSKSPLPLYFFDFVYNTSSFRINTVFIDTEFIYCISYFLLKKHIVYLLLCSSRLASKILTCEFCFSSIYFYCYLVDLVHIDLYVIAGIALHSVLPWEWGVTVCYATFFALILAEMGRYPDVAYILLTQYK